MRDFLKNELFVAGFVAFLVFACGFMLKNAEDKEKSIEVNQTVSERAKDYTEILKARVLQTSYDDLVFEFPRNFQPVKVGAILHDIKHSGMGCAKRVLILSFNGLLIVLVDILNFSIVF